VYTFHIWLTALLPIKESKLIAGLVHKGYAVSAAASTDELSLVTNTNATYGILACKVHRELASTSELYDDLCVILAAHHFTYYSLIISEFSTLSMWNAGNAVIDTLPSIDDKPFKKTIN